MKRSFSPSIGAAAAVAALMLSTGCYKTTVINDTVPPGTEEHSRRLAYFFWGLAGDHEVDTREMCKGKVREVAYLADPLDVVVHLVTLGIVSPRTVEVECAGKAPPLTASGVPALGTKGSAQ